MALETKKKWRWGVKRWVILFLIILSAVLSQIIAPVQPDISVAAENISHAPLFGNFYLTNSLITTIIGDIIIIAIAWAVKKATSSGDLVPRGISGAMEALVEALYNMTENSAGKKWAKTIFPYFLTITLTVLIANWVELIPGVDSIGWLEPVQTGGHPAMALTSGISALVKEGGDAGGQMYRVVPFLRPPSTDLNFTAALALIAVFMIQVVGIRAQGPVYLAKFFDLRTIASKPGLGLMDFIVSILELISEFSKILSFAFRLFGNMFAGSVLLFIVGVMMPFLQSGILLFEAFIGLIQAIVFGMLTMIFMSMATQAHGGEENHAAA